MRCHCSAAAGRHRGPRRRAGAPPPYNAEMGTAGRFLWRATRKHRLRPWRSPYLRWRVETFSGLEAERIGMGAFLGFCWRERRALLRFLRWTGSMQHYRRLARHPAESAQAGPSEYPGGGFSGQLPGGVKL